MDRSIHGGMDQAGELVIARRREANGISSALAFHSAAVHALLGRAAQRVIIRVTRRRGGARNRRAASAVRRTNLAGLQEGHGVWFIRAVRPSAAVAGVYPDLIRLKGHALKHPAVSGGVPSFNILTV